MMNLFARRPPMPEPDPDQFAEFCANNDLDPEDYESVLEWEEAEAERLDPYGSRGLSPRDFL